MNQTTTWRLPRSKTFPFRLLHVKKERNTPFHLLLAGMIVSALLLSAPRSAIAGPFSIEIEVGGGNGTFFQTFDPNRPNDTIFDMDLSLGSVLSVSGAGVPANDPIIGSPLTDFELSFDAEIPGSANPWNHYSILWGLAEWWSHKKLAAPTPNVSVAAGQMMLPLTEMEVAGAITGDPSNGGQGFSDFLDLLVNSTIVSMTVEAQIDLTTGSGSVTEVFTIPEPSTLAMVSLGGLMLARQRRRRWQAQ